MKPIHSTSTSLLVLPLLAAIGLLACDTGAQNPPPPDATSAAAEAPARPLPAPASSDETYVVTVGSGPFAGTYRGADEMNCMIEDGDWAADFDAERERGISALSVTLDGVTEAGGTGENVHVMVMFGRLGDAGGNVGAIGAGGALGGSARATATREGGDAVMQVEGTTATGAPLSVMIRCRSES